MLGEPFIPHARFHQDYIRVIPPDGVDRLRGPFGVEIPSNERDSMQLLWEQLPMLTTIFRFRDFEPFGERRGDRGRDFFSGADFITAAIRELGKL